MAVFILFIWPIFGLEVAKNISVYARKPPEYRRLFIFTPTPIFYNIVVGHT